MNFHVLTLFPEMIMSGLNHSILKRAITNGLININCINIRDFADNKNKRVDDYSYGGGAGMIIQAGPVYDAYKSVSANKVIYLTPQGKVFNQQMANELANECDIILLCGHYEGIDERVLEEIVTDEVSVGDYVLTGGELPAMILIDAVARLIPGVLNKPESHMNETFANNLLEYPQYTRPQEFHGKHVPEVLLSGNHAAIDKWRYEQSIARTLLKRPDLFEKGD